MSSNPPDICFSQLMAGVIGVCVTIWRIGADEFSPSEKGKDSGSKTFATILAVLAFGYAFRGTF
jgi:hypothetical protein